MHDRYDSDLVLVFYITVYYSNAVVMLSFIMHICNKSQVIYFHLCISYVDLLHYNHIYLHNAIHDIIKDECSDRCLCLNGGRGGGG